MAFTSTQAVILCVLGILSLAQPAQAFGAGNIASVSKIEGQNWRHGDIEDVLLGIAASRALNGKFGKLDIKRVYFGNWLRDYSQAVDVGTVKYVSAKAITMLLWILGFMSFGYGTKEFEVTMDRLGCYRPEEHIDNPKDYADNEDATQYDRRLRGKVDERRELAIDHETGMKSYIASENAGITTSAGLVRKLFGQCIELGRRYNRNGNKADLYEALRLLGTGCHCLEDFSAHSNYVELALIELGERNTFPHVGRNTHIQLRGARQPVFPLITGTFGGVDFLHSVTGEFDDKTTQSEIQELETTMQQAQQNQESTSMLQDLLNKLPSGIFGDKNEAGKADELKQNAVAHQMSNTSISPRQSEEWTAYLDDVRKQVYPIIEFHDGIMQSITETIEKIPILPDLLENLTEQLNVFVFSLIAPFVLPIISQVKTELTTGSSAIIQSSVEAQHIVFRDDNSSDPTHSMLSKDHFSNVLNEPAGKVAGQVLKWVVPQLMTAWDDERIDINRTLNRIIQGVMHHPALREQGSDGSADGRRLMFQIVQQWWGDMSPREKDGLRDQLSRQGVESGRNHKPGVIDHGHGSCKPLGMPGMNTAASSGAPAGLGGFPGGSGSQSQVNDQAGRLAAQAVGGGALGGLVGGLVSNLGGGLLGGDLDNNQETFNKTSYDDDGSRTQTITQIGQAGNRYGQAQYSRTEDVHGGRTEEFNRYEQTSSGGRYQTEVHHEQRTSSGGYHEETRRYGSDDRENQTYGGRHHESTQFEPESGFGNFSRRPEPEFHAGRQGMGDERFGRRQSPGFGENEAEHRGGGRRHNQFDQDDDSSGGNYGHGRPSDFGSGHGYGTQQSNYGRSDDNPGRFGRGEEPHVSGGFGQEDEAPGFGRGGHGERHERFRGRQENYNQPQEQLGRRAHNYGEPPQEEFSDRQDFGGGQRRHGEESEPTHQTGGYSRRDDDEHEQTFGSRNHGRQDEDEVEQDFGSRGYGNRQEDEGESYGRRRGYGEDNDETGGNYGY